jgi:RND family efflux transporter MFP subunit
MISRARLSVCPPAVSSRRLWSTWALSGLVAGLVWWNPVQAQAPVVPVAEVAMRPVGDSLVLDATLEAIQHSTLSAQASGRIVQITVKAGDPVKAGQVLAIVDDRTTQAGVVQAQAGVAQADAAVAQAEVAQREAQLHWQRTQDLQAQQFVSQAALDMAQARLRAAEAGVQQAQAGRSQARAHAAQSGLAQGFTRLSAPYDGFVRHTHAQAGDLAAPGLPILTVYAPQALRAVVHVPASRLGTAQGAQRTEIEWQGPAGPQWVAPVRVTRVPAADPVSQTVEWRLDLSPEHSVQALPGQQTRVRFVAGQSMRLTVPEAAVLRRGELTAVYLASPNGFTLRAVRLGASHTEGGTEVLSGLKAGERVALDPVRAGLAGARAAQ